jgi:anthranilate/para-aminobenzoate synthase component I
MRMPPERYAEILNRPQFSQEQIDAYVKERLQLVGEKIRNERDFPDIWNDPEQLAEHIKLEANLAQIMPDMAIGDRIAASAEAVRRGHGQDIDYATHIASEKAHRRRMVEDAGSDEAAHQPAKADLEIAESEAAYQASVAESMAAIVKGRGPQVAPQRSEEQKLRDERIALERRRRAAGW